MNKMTVVSKSAAMKIKANYPNASVMKYCNGKYQWHGSAKHYIGKEVKCSSNVLTIYVERRQDSHGAYARMMCVVKPS